MILIFCHIPKVSYWLQFCWLGRSLKYTEPIVMFLEPVWDNLHFVKWCIFILEAAIIIIAINKCKWSTKARWKTAAFKWCLTWFKEPIVFHETFPTPLQHHQQSELFTHGRLGPWILDVDGKFWPNHLQIHQTRWHFNRPQPPCTCVPTVAWFLFLAKTRGTQCGLQLLRSPCLKVHLVVHSEILLCSPWLHRGLL